jgi:fatty acid desaturase
MKKIALLGAAAMILPNPSMARWHHHHHFYPESPYHRPDRENSVSSHPQITCEMVRAYVAQVGLVQAKALAQSEGITPSQERQAVRCLEKKI